MTRDILHRKMLLGFILDFSMASDILQIAKENGFLKDDTTPESSSCKGVMTVESGMIEELDSTTPVERSPRSGCSGQ